MAPEQEGFGNLLESCVDPNLNAWITRNNYTEKYLNEVNQIQKVWKKQFVLN